ncbi:MAG: sigma-54-dependent Fis family transcriptional regulator [Alphaproteobacteria bacterium]|nr:sigma-54-dependent Fis family transcriptional regulator [Alphaproteobacteria bacterium]
MSKTRTILIVEDSPSLAATYSAQLGPTGHRVLVAGDGKTAYALMREHPVDCLLLDLNLPDMDGLSILEETRSWQQPPAVVVITANASLTTAVSAVRQGASDYLVKPFAAARLLTTLENALAATDLRREVATLRRTVEQAEFGGFTGRSLPMQAVYRVIEAAGRSDASVFITGESGTGKELTAEALHRSSSRRERNFVALNCGAIPKELMESVVFGHIKGSFTGATADQEGAAARADGGTLFLDELGEMDPLLQTKLLRFIQTGTYQRVGESRTRDADIRFIAATNRDPEEAVRQGRLREDLFYRLHVVPIRMPPLRDRGEDILLIARKFLAQYSELEGKPMRRFAADVEARFLAYSWPGNVRQLQNVIRSVVVLGEGEVVTSSMLPPLLEHVTGEPLRRVTTEVPTLSAPMSPSIVTADDIEPLADVERQYIEQAIAACSGNLQLAARRLRISPSTIYRKRETWTTPCEAVELMRLPKAYHG